MGASTQVPIVPRLERTLASRRPVPMVRFSMVPSGNNVCHQINRLGTADAEVMVKTTGHHPALELTLEHNAQLRGHICDVAFIRELPFGPEETGIEDPRGGGSLETVAFYFHPEHSSSHTNQLKWKKRFDSIYKTRSPAVKPPKQAPKSRHRRRHLIRVTGTAPDNLPPRENGGLLRLGHGILRARAGLEDPEVGPRARVQNNCGREVGALNLNFKLSLHCGLSLGAERRERESEKERAIVWTRRALKLLDLKDNLYNNIVLEVSSPGRTGPIRGGERSEVRRPLKE